MTSELMVASGVIIDSSFIGDLDEKQINIKSSLALLMCNNKVVLLVEITAVCDLEVLWS